MMIVRLTIAAGLIAAAGLAQSGGDRFNPQVQTTFDSVELAGAAADHVRFDVYAHVTAAKNVTIERVRFDQMRLGGIPFYLSPIEQRLELKAGRPVALPAIPMTIYFRDLDSLAPVEEAISNGEVHVRGHALADIDLSLMEKILMGEWSGHADVAIDEPIAISLPGGFVGRTAALLALSAADAALRIAGSALNVMRTSQKRWTDQLQTEFGQSIVVAESRYKLVMNDGQTVNVSNRGLGFRIAGDRILLAGALAEPWKYDPETAVLIETRKANVPKESVDILVWPGEGRPEDAAALSNGRLQLEKVASKTEKTVAPDGEGTTRINLARRDTDSNYAILRFTSEADKRGPLPEARSEPGQSWERVALYRLTDAGPLQLIFVPARRQENRLIFDTPVDDSAVGSPVMTPEGAIGMLQDERSGMVLKSNW